MLTDRASRRLEAYLADVGRRCDPLDRDNVVEDLRAHVTGEACARSEPVDDAQMQLILERLGEPASFADPERQGHAGERIIGLVERWLAGAAMLFPIIAIPALIIGQAQRGGLWEGLAGAAETSGVHWSPGLIALAAATALVLTIAVHLVAKVALRPDSDVPTGVVSKVGIALAASLGALAGALWIAVQ